MEKLEKGEALNWRKGEALFLLPDGWLGQGSLSVGVHQQDAVDTRKAVTGCFLAQHAWLKYETQIFRLVMRFPQKCSCAGGSCGTAES